MEATKYWYSIISYTPKTLLNERLNVGVIIHNPSQGIVKWFLLDEKNKKLHSIFTSQLLKEEYKVRKNLFEHRLQKSSESNSTLQDYQLNDENLFKYISQDFSPYFLFSKRQLIIAEEVDIILTKLLEIYISSVFLEKNVAAKTVKYAVRKLFEEHSLLGTKIKADVPINPIKEISNLNYKVDFLYKNSNYHLMQTVPKNNDSLNEWFSKMILFQQEYQNKYNIEIIFDKERIENYEDAKNILSYLNKNPSTEIIDLQSRKFNQLCENITHRGLPISEYDDELLII